ncbi:MAG: LytR/AlgR family response regulator transcription factor [Lysobacterales bacterium]
MIRLLIIDDTRLARQELKTLLSAHADVSIVGEADDLPSARQAIDMLQPQLLLLDIQLPSGTGFDLLESLDPLPLVIFTTAYDQYAVRAFETSALDYLVKPVAPERLSAALDRARTRLLASHCHDSDTRPRLGADDTVFLREGERCWFVALKDISHIEVDGNYARVHFRDGRATLARSLSALESRLDPNLFLRANRNTLVNLRAIASIDPWINDGYQLKLRNGSEIEVSRRQARELRERLSL